MTPLNRVPPFSRHLSIRAVAACVILSCLLTVFISAAVSVLPTHLRALGLASETIAKIVVSVGIVWGLMTLSGLPSLHEAAREFSPVTNLLFKRVSALLC